MRRCIATWPTTSESEFWPESSFGRGYFAYTSRAEGTTETVAKTNANLIWKIADLLRGPYQPNKYGDVTLPFTILRRLDCILEPTKDQVLAEYGKIQSTKVDPRYSSKVSSSICFSSKVSRIWTPTLYRTIRRVSSLPSINRRRIGTFSANWRAPEENLPVVTNTPRAV